MRIALLLILHFILIFASLFVNFVVCLYREDYSFPVFCKGIGAEGLIILEVMNIIVYIFALGSVFILPTFHFFHVVPRLPSENGGLSGRTTEKLKWNRYILQMTLNQLRCIRFLSFFIGYIVYFIFLLGVATSSDAQAGMGYITIPILVVIIIVLVTLFINIFELLFRFINKGLNKRKSQNPHDNGLSGEEVES